MTTAGNPSDKGYDVFLSHASPDKPWVGNLQEHLSRLGLQAFLDVRELQPGDNFVLTLSDALLHSRFLAVVLTRHAVERPWVTQEWTAFMAEHGPTRRIILLVLEPVDVPTILKPVQRLDATHHDAERAARDLANLTGRPLELKEGDARRLTIGQDLVFALEPVGEMIRITDPVGKARTIMAPWSTGKQFDVALWEFEKRSRDAMRNDAQRAEAMGYAVTLGQMLFDLLFAGPGVQDLKQAAIPGQMRPQITILSQEDWLLALPWELIYHGDSFLVRDGRVDLARSTPGDVGPGALAREPRSHFKLVVNVSAPEGSALSYEAESYRLTRALAERCEYVPTELGTLEDLVETVKDAVPTGIHFSGHGSQGELVFEDDEGRGAVVPVSRLVSRLKERLPGVLPTFFYLACCHGNTTDRQARGLLSKLENSAARLHREGAAQVVSYHGPIVDELSTRAEVALYAAIAEGETTAYAVRQARAALLRPLASSELTHPFAWAQLAYYQRGPDRPLSLPARPGQHRQMEAELQRTFQGMGNRRVLATGFIGRRTELHQVRRRIREGQRVLVFQGLGGLGKTTLAFHTLPLLSDAQNQCTLWCQEVEKEPDRAEGLVGQLLAYCRTRFGVDWEPVVQKVDRAAGNDPVQRFGYYLNSLLDRAPGFVLYFDNLESLLIGPKELAEGPADAGAFAQWHSAPVAGIWALARQTAEDSDRLYVVASCRYRHADFGRALLPVALLPADALYRLMGWFPALRRLASATRAELVQRLAGHPRAVEFANTLLDKALADWQESHGAWRLPAALTETDLKREWDLLVAPALPRVQDQLWANLLLSAIWERVLDEQARRMLYRMTLLRRPWDADLIPHLSDPEDLAAAAEATAARLRRTSLLEQVEVGLRCLYTLHPATAQFVVENFAKPRRSSWFRRFARWFQPAQKPAQATEADLRRETHLRIGAWLEGRARNSVDRDVPIEAAYHLFQAKEYQRAYVVLSAPTHEMLNSGQAREALHLLEPFLAESLRPALTRPSVMRLLGKIGQGYWELSEPQKATVLHDQRLLLARELGDVREEGAALGDLGIAYHHLGQVEKAIGYYEQSLVIARQLGDRGLEGTNLGNLGCAYHDLGQTEKAISFHDQALAIARQVGDRNGEGFALGNLGLAYRALGQVEKEISYHEQQLVIMRQISNRRGEAMALNNLGGAYVALGQVDKAIGCHERQLVIERQISSRHGEGNALGGLGVAYHALGQVDKAIGYYEQQLAIVREIGDRHHEANALGNLGRAYGQLGDEVKATGYAEQQLRIAREILDRFQERDALGQLGQYAIKTGDSKKAIAYFENAQRVAQETGDQIGVITSFGNLGSAYSGLGQMAKALDCYAKQGEIARAIGDRRGEADSLCDQGRVHWKLGDPTKAIGFYEQALAISREVVGHRRTEGAALCNMGIAYKDLRLIDKARPLLEQALRIGQELQDSEITRSASTNLERLAGIPAPR